MDSYKILHQLEHDEEIDVKLVLKELIKLVIKLETDLMYIERDLNEVLYDH